MSRYFEEDDDFAIPVGITSDLFSCHGWYENKTIYIASIVSCHPRQGNLSRLLTNLEKLGYTVAILIPLPLMESILKHKGFIETWLELSAPRYPSITHAYIKEPKLCQDTDVTQPQEK